MTLGRIAAGLALAVSLSALPLPVRGSEPLEPRDLQETLDRADSVRVEGRELRTQALWRFYRSREFAPAWGPDAEGTARAAVALEALARARDHGLVPADYALAALQRRAEPATLRQALERELLLTDAVLRYAVDVRGGRVRPAAVQADWGIVVPPPGPAPGLVAAVEAGTLAAWLAGQPPSHDGYARLVDALRRYHAVADRGGWPTIPPGPAFAPGMRDPRLALLRERLALDGDLEPADATAGGDAALDQAVRRFQRRHGLETDGVVGPDALRALNVPVARRIRQVAVNLERWRWLPRELDRRHLAVNAADATLAVVEDGRVTLASRVVVGDAEHPTPVVQASVNAVVYNPSWTVPTSMVVEEFLPRLRANPRFLAANDIEILERPDDPHGLTVDWGTIPTARFPYRLQQRPGPGNPLGRIRFGSPNRFDVYLHDTPLPELFERANRALSHGCVRVERARELAALVLAGQPAGRREAIDRAIAAGTTSMVAVSRPLPLYLLYWTAFAGEDGQLHLREDLYARDGRLAAALFRATRPAAPRAAAAAGAVGGR